MPWVFDLKGSFTPATFVEDFVLLWFRRGSCTWWLYDCMASKSNLKNVLKSVRLHEPVFQALISANLGCDYNLPFWFQMAFCFRTEGNKTSIFFIYFPINVENKYY